MNKKRMLFYLIFAAVAFLFFTPLTIASDSVTYLESFEDDTVNSNPSESWYSYGESGIQWANVTDMTGFESTQSFLMNTTSDTYGGVLYDVVDSSYDYIELNVKINTSQHNFTMITVGTWIDNEWYTGNGAFCFWRIGTYDGDNYNIDFHVITTAEGNITSEIYNESINNNTWYRLRAEFDYDAHEVTGYIWNEEGLAGVPVQLDSNSSTCDIPFTNITQSFWAIPEHTHGADSCYIFMDDFTLGSIVADSALETYGLPIYLIMMGLVILVLFIIVLMFSSGVSIDANFAISLILMFVFIIATLGILGSLA